MGQLVVPDGVSTDELSTDVLDKPRVKPRVYIAGPMRGYQDFNFPAFYAAEEKLRAEGYEVINPARIDNELGFDETANTLDGFDTHGAMRRDIEALLTCDAICPLPGWEHSWGARIEMAVAEGLGLRVIGAEADLELVE